MGILRAPESRWKRIWGAKWRRGGVIAGGGRMGSVMTGDGERFCPGENEGGEEGLYKSSDLTREKVQGCG